MRTNTTTPEMRGQIIDALRSGAKPTEVGRRFNINPTIFCGWAEYRAMRGLSAQKTSSYIPAAKRTDPKKTGGTFLQFTTADKTTDSPAGIRIELAPRCVAVIASDDTAALKTILSVHKALTNGDND